MTVEWSIIESRGFLFPSFEANFVVRNVVRNCGGFAIAQSAGNGL